MNTDNKNVVLTVFREGSQEATKADRLIDLVMLIGNDSGENRVVASLPKAITWDAASDGEMNISEAVTLTIADGTPNIDEIFGVRILSSKALVAEGLSSTQIDNIYAGTLSYADFIADIGSYQGTYIGITPQTVEEGQNIKIMSLKLSIND